MRSVLSQALRSGPLRRAHLSLAAVAALLAAAFFTVNAIVQAWSDKRNERDRLELAVRQLEQRLAAAPFRSPVSSAEGRDVKRAAFAETAAEAEKHARDSLRRLTAAPELGGVQIENVHALPAVVEAGLRASRLSAALSVPSTEVFEMINLLESATPSILIDSIRILARPSLGSDPKSLPRSSVQVTVRVYAQEDATRPPSAREPSR